MKGDFTRFTHDPKKHYTGVLKQQGRVDLDADWNEQVEIQEHLQKKSLKDIIGRCGAPEEGGGFRIDVVPADFFGIYFPDKSHGWVVGSRATILAMEKYCVPPADEEEIKYVRQSPPVGVTEDLHEVFFLELPEGHHGWAVGDGGIILATADGGRRWEKCESGTSSCLRGVFFLEKDLGWAVGLEGTILNWDGKKWTVQNSGTSSDLYAVHFIKNDNGYAVGAGGAILHWDGLIWSSQTPVTNNDLLAVCFLNEKNGYAVGTKGSILFWNGQNWKFQNPSTYDLHSIHFSDTNAYVASDDGKVYNLINGEILSYETLYNGKLYSIFFRDGVGCSVGKGGAIFVRSADESRWARERLGDFLCSSIMISQGSINVDGILAEMDHEATIWNQPDCPLPQSLEAYRSEDGKPRTDLVYLDVWQRIITFTDDPEIREVALGGPDTTVRKKTVCQVRVLLDVDNGDCDLDLARGVALSTKAIPADAPKDQCKIMPSGGYSGIENRLYRVEVHDGGVPYLWPRPEGIETASVMSISSPLGHTEYSQIELKTDEWELDDLNWQTGQAIEVFSARTENEGKIGRLARIMGIDEERRRLTLDTSLLEMAGDEGLRARRVATFKWSRDNGSVVYPVEKFVSSNKIKLKHLGRDQRLTIRKGDWIEVLDDAAELLLRPGSMAQIEEDIDGEQKEVVLSKEIDLLDEKGHPKVRRWDQRSDVIPVAAQESIDLGDGIQIEFSKRDDCKTARLKNGDYWVFAARTAKGNVEALENAPPRGIEHHYCNLALITWKADGTTNSLIAAVKDCRRTFPSLTDLIAMYYVGGDGQDGVPPDWILDKPLQVGVANGGIPAKGFAVRFSVKTDSGTPKSRVHKTGDTNWRTFVDDITSDDGIASCRWRLDPDGPGEMVEATLLYPGKHIPIRFAANFRLASLTKVIKINAIWAADKRNKLTPIVNNEEVKLNLIHNGLRLECDKIIEGDVVKDKPVFDLIVDLPYPDAKDPIYFQPIKLAGVLSAGPKIDKGIISWEPRSSTIDWLMNYFDMTDIPLLANIELKGNFIWTKDSNDIIYLDGDSFAMPESPNGLSIGDRIGGGDLRMWFKLARPATTIAIKSIKKIARCSEEGLHSAYYEGEIEMRPRPKNDVYITLIDEAYDSTFPESPEMLIDLVTIPDKVKIPADSNTGKFGIGVYCYYIPSDVGAEIKITAQYQDGGSLIEDHITFHVDRPSFKVIF